MRRAYSQILGLTVLALTATGFASAALAQTAVPTSAPARYLNWAGRGDVSMAGVVEAPSQPNAPHRRANRVIPHGGAYEIPGPIPAAAPDALRRTLTPANAWMRPPALAPAPVALTVPPPPPVAARALPDFVPDRGGRGQPAPADVVLASPPPDASVAAPVDDPMAPRRDAPIFRMQRTPAPASVQASPAPQGQAEAAPAPATSEPRRVAMVAANPDDHPAQQGARYYSVHRQAGREPDALSLPQPTYVDALAVTAPVTIASQDLAQPDPAPTLIRDAQGRVRAQPAAPEGDYQ